LIICLAASSAAVVMDVRVLSVSYGWTAVFQVVKLVTGKLTAVKRELAVIIV
jgi:hypothetical protein